jgi:basic amino acid/polyamine antiporter, APA family
MVFVLLTYGGWNEAAYLSAEVRTRRGIVWALLVGIAIITAIYLLVNASMLHALGLTGMASSKAVATEVMRMRFGDGGAKLVSLFVVLAALTTANGTIITGARSNYALGRDFPLLGALGRWRERGSTPTTALIAQGIIALCLVIFGSLSRNGLKSMIDYITPVFWLFFLLTGISLFVLRSRDRGIERPFKVPFYPLTPLLFCGVCAYMLWSSLNYAGWYSWVGLAVLVAGVPLLLAARPRATINDRRRGFAVETEPPVVQQQT